MSLFGLQRAAAAAGHCDPPVRLGSYRMEDLEGMAPAWAQWVERWHATSTLTPRVRSIVRCIMAKAGRWLAAEHPDITEPAQWEQGHLRGVGRGRGPHAHRRLRLAQQRAWAVAPEHRSLLGPRFTTW